MTCTAALIGLLPRHFCSGFQPLFSPVLLILYLILDCALFTAKAVLINLYDEHYIIYRNQLYKSLFKKKSIYLHSLYRYVASNRVSWNFIFVYGLNEIMEFFIIDTYMPCCLLFDSQLNTTNLATEIFMYVRV